MSPLSSSVLVPVSSILRSCSRKTSPIVAAECPSWKHNGRNYSSHAEHSVGFEQRYSKWKIPSAAWHSTTSNRTIRMNTKNTRMGQVGQYYYDKSLSASLLNNTIQQQKNTFSSTITNAASAPSMSTSFRNLVKPFLLKCHPDVVTDRVRKSVNLVAVQSLNSYLDRVETILLQKTTADAVAADSRKGNRIVEIEFYIPISIGSSSESLSVSSKKHRKKNPLLLVDDDDNEDEEDNEMKLSRSQIRTDSTSSNWSRRKVELTLPSTSMLTTNNDSGKNTEQMKRHIVSELVKLLHVAGLPIPSDVMYDESVMGSGSGNFDYDNNYVNGHERTQEMAWEYELGLTRPGKGTNQEQQTAYEQSRSKFMKSIDWNKYQRMYKRALEELHANISTMGIISNNPHRKRNLVATIVSRIKFLGDENVPSSSNGHDDNNNNQKVSNRHESNDTIPFLEKWIALRRLSLLLENDCFDLFQLEQYSRLWEEGIIHIILTPERPGGGLSTSALHRRQFQSTSRSNTKPSSSSSSSSSISHDRLSFHFVFHTDGSVSIHVPIDFRTDEFIDELEANLSDIYDIFESSTDDKDAMFL